ncbi:MAG: peptidylprolyl isomerase [Phycisphaerales bacterium]|nr:peptidylprolyl isomerase [Phycisphaerales bacterium]
MNIEMKTSVGTIALTLDPQKAPVSAANFAQYAKDGHYDGTIFHRVIDGFMIQGGGFTPDMTQKPTRPGIANEWKNGLKNTRGTIAMARLGGKADSATSQFFINVADNGFLDRPQPDGAAYAVFGKVTRGMEVVDQIKGVATGTRAGMGDVPATPIVIESVRVVE